MPGVTLQIKPGSELHTRIISGVRDRVRASQQQYADRHKKWKDNEERALAYLPERDVDAARRVEREGGKPQYTTIQVPYSYAVLMASHTYWTTVFMSRTPVLQFTGRHGESQQKVQAIEAIIDYQLQVGKMLVPLYIWLHDVGKYGIGIIGTFWEQQESVVSVIEEREELLFGVVPTGKKKRIKTTSVVPGYVGNKVYNIRPFDFFPDPRVPMHRFQDGEFCAVYNEIGWNTALERQAQGIYTNLKFVRPEGVVSGNRVEGSAQLILPDAFAFGTELDKKKGSVIPAFECVINLVPEVWGLGRGTRPEKWVFTVTADWKFVIGAQPLGFFHNQFPYTLIEFEPEGYALANRGIPEILEPVQNTIDWLINAHFYNVRKALNDQFVVDPSKVMMVDVEDPLPGGIIRLSPMGYGSDTRTVITQLGVVDVTQNHLRDLQMMLGIGERVLGVNDQILGVLQGGGRKTATEVRTAATSAIFRLKTSSEYMSAMGWWPWAQMLVQNSQQLYDDERAFKIVGDLIQEAGPQFLKVAPQDIQGFFDFVPVDGTLPLDRFAQANLWRELLNQMRQSPEILAQYDIGRIFAWVAQLAGLKNINQFRTQLRPDEQLQAQAQQGNIIPLGQAGARDLDRVGEPGQISGLGATG